MAYLGKKNLHRLLCTVVDKAHIEPCLGCHYYSHKGMEWLIVPKDDFSGIFQITNNKSYVSVELYGNEEGGTKVSIDRMTYSYDYFEDRLELIWHRYPQLTYI